jgi:putative ABC transport system substrate-binding protein
MNRKVFWVGALLFALCFPVEAQQAKKIPRIGFLHQGSLTDPQVEAFRQGLRDLGYVEGKNITVEHRSAEGRPESYRDLATELVRLKVDIIVVGGGAQLAAKNATATIPIVMASSSDPVGTGFVASLARPGGNITGLTNISSELAGKRLELLKETVPGLSRVAIVAYSDDPAYTLQIRDAEDAAQGLKVQVQILKVREPNDFESAFAAAKKGRAGAISILQQPLFTVHRKTVVDLAKKSRLPAMYGNRQIVEDGGLMSYEANLSDLYRRAATFVDKILKGAKPEDLPVEQPTKFELVINLKTAKQIGVTIPPSVLYRADKVIK